MARKAKRKENPGKGAAGADEPLAKLEDPFRWAGPVLFAVALVVRLVSFAEISISPLADFPAPDAEYYLRAGAELYRDGLWSGGVFAMNPLYTVVVGWLVPLVGIAGIRIVQVILGALTSWLIYRIGTRVFGAGAGLVAGLAHAFYPMAILFSLALLPVTLAAAGSAAAVLLALRTSAAERAAPALTVGLLLGLSSLARPNLLLWGGAFLAWYWWNAPRATRRSCVLLLIAGVALPLAFTTARNLAVSGHPVLISSNGGVNFYYGNHRGANGAFSIPPGFPDTPLEQLTAARALAEAETGRALTPPEVSRHWFSRGRQYVLGHPVQSVLLWVRKAALMVNAWEMPINEGLVEYGEFSRTLRIPLPWFGLMAPLGLAGLLLSAGHGDRAGRRLLLLVLAAHLAGILPFFVSSRHRFPMLIALLPFAGFALVELRERWRVGDRRKLLFGLVILALAAVLCWLPLVPESGHFGYNRLGCLYLEAEDTERAEVKFRQALSRAPGYADAHFNLGRVLTHGSRYDEAIRAYEQALALQPDRRDALLNLALALDRAHRPAEAEERYLSLIRLDPGYVPAHYNLAMIRMRAGRTDEAVNGLIDVIRLDPMFTKAYVQVGMLLKDMPGEAARAAEYLRTYLRLEPGGPFADMARSELATLDPGP